MTTFTTIPVELIDGGTYRLPKGVYRLHLIAQEKSTYDLEHTKRTITIFFPRRSHYWHRVHGITKLFRTHLAKEHEAWAESLVHVMNERYFQIKDIGKVRVKDMKSRWGSCSVKKNLNFSVSFLFVPENLRRYLIIHEMAHMVHMDHSHRFWETVGRILPNHKKEAYILRRVRVQFSVKGTALRELKIKN